MAARRPRSRLISERKCNCFPRTLNGNDGNQPATGLLTMQWAVNAVSRVIGSGNAESTLNTKSALMRFIHFSKSRCRRRSAFFSRFVDANRRLLSFSVTKLGLKYTIHRYIQRDTRSPYASTGFREDSRAWLLYDFHKHDSTQLRIARLETAAANCRHSFFFAARSPHPTLAARSITTHPWSGCQSKSKGGVPWLRFDAASNAKPWEWERHTNSTISFTVVTLRSTLR